jgi:hypothetical protein
MIRKLLVAGQGGNTASSLSKMGNVKSGGLRHGRAQGFRGTVGSAHGTKGQHVISLLPLMLFGQSGC